MSSAPESKARPLKAGNQKAITIGAERRRLRYFLAVSIAAILGATLTPSKGWEGAKSNVLCVFGGRGALADTLGNVFLFLPLGAALGLQGYATMRALLFGGLLSFGIEVVQFAIPGRAPSLADLLFNALGAALGSGLSRTPHGAALWSALSRSACVLARPESRLASRLALGAALAAGAVFGLTGVLLAPAYPRTAYLSDTDVLQTTTMPLRIGGNTYPKENFRGRIDDVRIYNRARSGSEIQADMNVPVSARGTPALPSTDLVAAYGFDEGTGTSVADASGHGNAGTISGALWTSQGKFGGALVFDGFKDVVVIPDSPSLRLSTAITLEAWVYPTAPQSSWRAIVQKEVDAYLLTAGSDAGALRPGGGGTFGSIDNIKAPKAIPLNVWTHLALTYDGTTLRLYVNASEVASRTRWYQGRVLHASVGGLEVPPGALVHSSELRSRLLAGAPLRVHALAGPRAPALVPLLSLHAQDQHEILFLGPDQDDLVFRFQARAAALGLEAPELRVPGALRGLAPGDALTITVWRDQRGYCFDVNGTSTCGLGFTIGMGWVFLIYPQPLPGWLRTVLNGLWMAALFFPAGFWTRFRWESWAAGVVLGINLLLLPGAIGLLPPPGDQIGAAATGFLAGWGCRFRLPVASQGIG